MEAKQLKIIFFGTPEIAAIELEHLCKENYSVVAVVTNIDKPMGRGRKTGYSEVKQKALELGIEHILQPKSLKDEEFLEELKSFSADIGVVVAFRMMPREVYTAPRLGCFNLHTSLLPQYRGAAPINRAIINGEKKTGITTFLLNENIDCGEILLQKEIEIGEEMVFEQLYNVMAQEGKELIEQTLQILSEGKTETIKQSTDTELKPAPKIYKQDTYIDWHSTGKDIVNLIRGLCPIPAAKAFFEDKETGRKYEFKIFKAEKVFIGQKKEIGNLWLENQKNILVQCSDCVLRLSDLQLSGKKRMIDRELVKGLRIKNIIYAIE